MSLSLKYPQLFLLTYCLSQEKDTNEIINSWQQLRQKLNLKSEADHEHDQEFPFVVNERKYEGFYHRDLFGDTNSLLVGISYQDELAKTAEEINHLKRFINVNGNIGKTWLLLGFTDNLDTVSQEDISQEIVKILWKKQQFSFQETGKFINSNIYSFLDEEKNENFLLFLCPNQETMENLAHYYYDFLNIFYPYHKIIWAYQQAKKIADKLSAEKLIPTSEEIPEIKGFVLQENLDEQDYEQLKKYLNQNFLDLAQHIYLLECLSFQLQTFTINSNTYKKRLDILSKRINNQGINDLKFLEVFRDSIISEYQVQIEENIAKFSPGIKVRENIINTIRGIIEISQAQSDRRVEQQNQNFQKWVGIIGVGAAVSSTSASSIANFVSTIRQNQDQTLVSVGLLNFAFALSISLILGGVSSFIMWLILRKKQ